MCVIAFQVAVSVSNSRSTIFKMDDAMQYGDNWGWQETATSIKERTTYLWKNNPIPFNVTFDVGPRGQKERIGAHKYIHYYI